MFPESNVKDSVCTLINIILMLGCQQTIENNTKYLGIPLPLSQYLFPAWFVTCLSGCLGPCGCLKFGLVPEILPSSFLYMYRCAIPFLGSGFVFVLERGYPKWKGEKTEILRGLGRYAYLPFVHLWICSSHARNMPQELSIVDDVGIVRT